MGKLVGKYFSTPESQSVDSLVVFYNYISDIRGLTKLLANYCLEPLNIMTINKKCAVELNKTTGIGIAKWWLTGYLNSLKIIIIIIKNNK